MQALVPVSGASKVPAKPALLAPLPVMLDPFASVPSERNGVLRFIIIGRPHFPPLAVDHQIKNAAASLLANPYYRAALLTEMTAGLKQLAMLTASRAREPAVAVVYRTELRTVPAWLLRKAASAHVKVSRWFPTIAELLEAARELDSIVLSETERLWRIAECHLPA